MNHVLRAVPVPHPQPARNEDQTEVSSTDPGLETALYVALLIAKAEGELGARVDPKAAATMLVSLNTGLKVLARGGDRQHDRIRTTIGAALTMLAGATATLG